MADNPFQDPSVSVASGSSPEEPAPVKPAHQSVPVTSASPPWLSSQAAEEPRWDEGSMVDTPPPPQQQQQQQRTPAPGSNEPYTLSQLLTYTRLANVGAATFMIISSLTTLIANVDLTVAVLALYVSCFGCLMCCFETHLKQVSIVIADNFGFMYSARGRFVFLVLLATLCFALNTLGKITGILLCAVALLNVYVLWKHPEYERLTQEQDLKGTNPDSVQTMASSYAVNYIRNNPDQVTSAARAGAGWAAANPDVAMQGARAYAQARSEQQNEESFDL